MAHHPLTEEREREREREKERAGRETKTVGDCPNPLAEGWAKINENILSVAERRDEILPFFAKNVAMEL